MGRDRTGSRIGLAIASLCGNHCVACFEPRLVHFTTLASSVDRDVHVGPVGRNWLRRWFPTLKLSFTFHIFLMTFLIWVITVYKLVLQPTSTVEPQPSEVKPPKSFPNNYFFRHMNIRNETTSELTPRFGSSIGDLSGEVPLYTTFWWFIHCLHQYHTSGFTTCGIWWKKNQKLQP